MNCLVILEGEALEKTFPRSRQSMISSISQHSTCFQSFPVPCYTYIVPRQSLFEIQPFARTLRGSSTFLIPFVPLEVTSSQSAELLKYGLTCSFQTMYRLAIQPAAMQSLCLLSLQHPKECLQISSQSSERSL